MAYLSNGNTFKDMTSRSGTSGNGVKSCSSYSKRSKKKHLRESSLDMYNNIQLIEHKTADTCTYDRPDMLLRSVTSPGYQTKEHSVLSELEYISDYGPGLHKDGFGYLKKLEGSKSDRNKPFQPRSTSLDDANASTSSSSVTTRSPPLSRTNTLPANYSLSKSFSVSGHYSDVTPRRKKKLTLFSRQNSELLSSSVSSMQSLSGHDLKIPSPARFTSMYHAVRKGISEHISINTAEYNVLEVRQKEVGGINAAQSYGTDKQMTFLERIIKKLQYHQTQLDELHEAYTLQQRYREGAYKLKSALSSSRVSSRSSISEIKHDLSRCTETLCTIEQELTNLLGRFHFKMKGLLGFARLRPGDHYEVVIRYGAQKWKMRGSVKSSGDQSWDKTEYTMQPLLTDLVEIKVMEVKMLGKHSTVGNVSSETKDFFRVEPQDLLIDINDTATLKLNLTVSWSPFDGYESPGSHIFAAVHSTSSSRLRTRSVIERPSPAQSRPRSRLATAFSRPMSVIYSSSSANLNNSNNREYLEIAKLPPPAFATSLLRHNEVETANKMQQPPKQNPPDLTKSSVRSSLSEEEAFIAAISHSTPLPSDGDAKACEPEVFEDQVTLDPVSVEQDRLSPYERRVRRELAAKSTEINLMMDDYRGRYMEMHKLEEALNSLLDQLKLSKYNSLVSDGFSVSDDTNNEDDLEIPVFSTNNEESPKESNKVTLSTTGSHLCDEAILAHLHLVQFLLKDVGNFGPLKIRQVLALDKLKKQGIIILRILDIAKQDKEIVLEDLEEFSGRRGFLEMWRSCCDGRTSFCVSARTLRLELTSEFSRELRRKHPDVAEKVFPEVVKRIVSRPDLNDVEKLNVTLFQVSGFVNDVDGCHDDFAKILDKIGHEMFITSTLRCGIRELILVAIKRMSSLLALRISNLRALSHLLLDTDAGIRTAAAAHIKHISTEETLREKAVMSYAELLESSSKRDRQCSCIAIGFLSATECIAQLAYLCHSDTELEVRQAASNVLLSLGEEGREARDHAASTLLAQTMTQQVTLKNHARMGTAL
uniref:Protein FAM65A-like n=1 Tax=Phallusia mammillata TaxID=59560 RepID=A0A6F9DD86_9ASCI|nr:protein FAM65A-like [Phallusia mammillata]